MKKIFLFLILAYSYSFANMCTVYSSTYWQGWEDCAYKTSTVNVYGTSITACWNPSTGPYCYAPIPTALATDPNGVCYHDSQGNQVCTKNPDPSGGPRCNDLFQKDGQAYTCNPNTNEATPIPNSDGITPDPEDPDNNIPKCNDGYEYTSIPSMTVGGSGESGYTSWGCSASTNGGNTGTGNTGSTGDGSGGGTGSTGDGNITTKTNPDGSVTMTLPDGTTNTTYGDGVVITTYPDGSTSTTGGSGGVGGTSGGGSGGTSGTGTDGNTSNESETPTPETPIDETPVATSCSDSSLTLQEKMLCEMNAGMKKLNSESSPDNSLNNLINDMNKNLNTNITAVNTNIKTTNQKLDSMKNLQQHQLSQAVITNSKLNSIDTELKNLNTNLLPSSTDSDAIPNPYGLESKNFIDGLLNQYSTFKNNIDGQIDTLNNTFNNAKATFEQGVHLNLSNTEIVNCPITYTLDMSSFFNKQIPINIDFCEHTSKLKPLLYPIFLILMSLGVVFLAIRFIGVLI